MNLFFCLEKWWIFLSCTSKGMIMTFCMRNLKKFTFSCKKACIFTFIQKKVWIFTSLYKNILNHHFFPTNLFFFVWKSKKKKFLIHKSVLHYICILEVQLFWRTYLANVSIEHVWVYYFSFVVQHGGQEYTVDWCHLPVWGWSDVTLDIYNNICIEFRTRENFTLFSAMHCILPFLNIKGCSLA